MAEETRAALDAAHGAHAEAAARAQAQAQAQAQAERQAAVEESVAAVWREVEAGWVRRAIHEAETGAEAARQVAAAVTAAGERWQASLPHPHNTPPWPGPPRPRLPCPSLSSLVLSLLILP